ncbi:hypothetical protein ABZT45_44580 [Streptomyces sp. NPDC005356]
MPVDFPPWKAVYRFFRRWQLSGFLDVLHDALRELARTAAGRKTRPTAAIVDSQSVKASWHVAAETRGFDGGKKVTGRKRRGWSTPAAWPGIMSICPSCTRRW